MKNANENVSTIFMDGKFVVNFWSVCFLLMEPMDIACLCIQRVRGWHSNWSCGPVKWQSCESVKKALGCVETGFVDSVRR